VREVVYKPFAGELPAHQISTVIASICFVMLAYYKMRSHLLTAPNIILLAIGTMWVLMTIVTDFAIGRLITGASWDKLLHDYNTAEGRISILLLFTLFVTPFIIISTRNNFSPHINKQILSTQKL
jgi:uncharacterized Tic20 family protein